VPIISVVDCELGIRRRYFEIGTLIGLGIIVSGISPIVVSYSGLLSLDLGIGKIAATSL
jgi:hypothetical protein